ncbi:MAG: RNA pseudouridine synthase [Opitutaceae bacterium]|nr:RNA pseudouridine synthase [Opitutaceae bacterium]
MSHSDHPYPLRHDVHLLVRDANGLVALAKPAGVLSHPNDGHDTERALVQATYEQTGERYRWQDNGAERSLWMLNRLDSATSGVILLAETEDLAHAIRDLFRSRQVHKVYQALVFGVPHAPVQHWRDMLAIDKRGGQIRTHTQGHIPSEAQMRVLKQWRGSPSIALIELVPKTGRSHQLRVQCAKRHLPIIGDATYGDFGHNRQWAKTTGHKRLYLHSLATAFEYEWKGRRHAFRAEAPLPAEFSL